MSKRGKRWPIWKIAVATGACFAGAVALFWLSVIMGKGADEQATDPTGQSALLTFPAFIMILGVAASMLAILCVVWLVLRIREARTPVWERGGKKRKRR